MNFKQTFNKKLKPRVATSTKDFRTGEEWSRKIDRKATVRKDLLGRTVVRLDRTVTNYQDNPQGGRIERTRATSGYKKVYNKKGQLKRTKMY